MPDRSDHHLRLERAVPLLLRDGRGSSARSFSSETTSPTSLGGSARRCSSGGSHFSRATANPLIWPVAVLVTLWGVRLAYHIGRRDFAHGRGEDPRYAAWRAEWKFFVLRSYLQVFLLQGFFMLLVSTPLIVLAASSDESRDRRWDHRRRGVGRRLLLRVDRGSAARGVSRRAARDPGTGHGSRPVGAGRAIPTTSVSRSCGGASRSSRSGSSGDGSALSARSRSRRCWSLSRGFRSPRQRHAGEPAWEDVQGPYQRVSVPLPPRKR